MNDWFADLRYALRMARKSPLFTIVTVLLLACGIGFNTVIFTALYGLLLRPLPVSHPGNLVRLVNVVPPLGPRSEFRYEILLALKEHASSLYDVFGQEDLNVVLSDKGQPAEIRALAVTGNYFTTLGVPAHLGRFLVERDSDPGGETMPVVLSYRFWQRWFHGDPNILGQAITIGKGRFVIAGVMPREFHGITVETSPDVWTPYTAGPVITSSPYLTSVQTMSFEISGRLRSGVSMQQARAECYAIVRSSAEAYLASLKNLPPDVVASELEDHLQLESLERGVSRLREQFSRALPFLMGTACLLLLMVCANVANLLLARSAGRQQEIAVRFAVGASRTRIIRQLLTESLLLSIFGGIAGLFLAYIGMPLLLRAVPSVRMLDATRVPLAIDLDLDMRSFGFALLATILTALLFGLAPAWHSTTGGLSGTRVSSRWKGKQVLIACQTALCTLLLVSSGLLVRSLQNLQSQNIGFDKDKVVTFTLDPDMARYTPAQAKSLEQRLIAETQALPGVEAVGVASRGLMRGTGLKMSVAPEGQEITKKDFLNTSSNSVSPEYFGVLGMRLLAGRNFTPADSPTGKTTPIIVNETFARRFFPGRDAVGKKVNFGSNSPVKEDMRIIGVVSDAKYRSLREPLQPTIYGLWTQDEKDVQSFILHVRTRVKPESLIAPVEAILRRLDPRLPFTEVATLKAEVDASLWSERLVAWLASLVGAMSIALAAVGIYGLLAYLIVQRRREIGIRMALGAGPNRIVRWVAAPAIRMTLAGAAVGLCIALLAAPLVQQLLYGVSPRDLWTFSTALELIAAIALASAAIPAWRASRISPATALRQQE